MVTPDGLEEEFVTRLSRVGFDDTMGYLDGGFDPWKQAAMEYDTVNQVDADNLKELLEQIEPLFLMCGKRVNTFRNMPLPP